MIKRFDSKSFYYLSKEKFLSFFKNLLVEEHLMRIEIKRLRGLLNSKADNVMSLETRRLQLQTVKINTLERSRHIYFFI